MQPRLVLRTHYQVDEPATIKWLVRDLTSPVQSNYADRVADRLAETMRQAGKEFNPSAGRYAIDLARGLRLLTDNLVWTELGHLLFLSSEASRGSAEFELPLHERILFFRLLLESDGAALVFIARGVQEHGELPITGTTWNNLANEMVIHTYDAYLNLITDTATRVHIRGVRDQRRARPFSGKSGAHQMFVHLQTMYRIGILERADQGNSRRYRCSDHGQDTPTGRLLGVLPDVPALEASFKEHKWPGVAKTVFGDQLPESFATDPLTPEALYRRLRPLYDKVYLTGVALCPIKPLVEKLQIDQLVSGEPVISMTETMTILEQLRRKHPREIRFHVDRQGRPAFIRITDDFSP